ncbi:hypothetical protein BSKO_02531 [Bryopsis sp. KO-2023]|nr:hypothetical protein BSKO_02531 [Bryopsis sp. KO-2023]
MTDRKKSRTWFKIKSGGKKKCKTENFFPRSADDLDGLPLMVGCTRHHPGLRGKTKKTVIQKENLICMEENQNFLSGEKTSELRAIFPLFASKKKYYMYFLN